MPKAARHVRVTGRVQGVFFRAWTREQAERLGVFGWVRNCPDGSVDAHLEGASENVDQMIELLRRGPSGAQVDELEIHEVEPEKHDWFAVRH
jgi:acylphosphatase